LDKDIASILLVVAGGTIGLISSLVIAIIGHRFEQLRAATARTRELDDKKRELRLAILKEKFEPALDLLGSALKIIENSNDPNEAYRQFDALRAEHSYWVVRARLTDEDAQEYLSMAIRYGRIKESEEQWRSYGAKLILAAKQLSELYDRERERLFSENP